MQSYDLIELKGVLKLNMNKNRILIVAAHPDDEIIGCGGTISRLVEQGWEAFTLILGEGKTSRDETRNRNQRIDEINNLKKEVEKANNLIGVSDVFLYDFPDNRFDTVPLLDIIKTIEKIKNNIKPSMIFTHYKDDLNIDHRIINQAVLTATRPVKNEFVNSIYAFEIASSTEWKFPISFSPDVFYDISNYLTVKLKAMSEYESELKNYPHPRSLDGLKLISQYWGMRTGFEYAEAFKNVRILV